MEPTFSCRDIVILIFFLSITLLFFYVCVPFGSIRDFLKITMTLGRNLLNAKVTQDDHITYFIVITNLEIIIKYYHLDFGKIHCNFEIFCRPSKMSHQSNRMLKKPLNNVAIFVSSLSKKPPEIN